MPRGRVRAHEFGRRQRTFLALINVGQSQQPIGALRQLSRFSETSDKDWAAFGANAHFGLNQHVYRSLGRDDVHAHQLGHPGLSSTTRAIEIKGHLVVNDLAAAVTNNTYNL